MNFVCRIFTPLLRRNAATTACTAGASIIKRNDGVDYVNDLLALVSLDLVRMTQVASTTVPCFYIRHDVDSDLDMALRVAEVEASLGYFSTYFLLTPGSYRIAENYYGRLENGRIVHHPHLVDRCRRLLDLGHEIGFHNDLVPLSIRTGRPPGEILEDEMEFFAANRIPVRGMAAHGNPLCRRLRFNNRELFVDCVRKGWEPGRVIEHNGVRVQLHSLRMEEYGLEYEAYSLPRDSRISESGGRWGGRIAGERLPKERWSEGLDYDEFRRTIQAASAENRVRAFSVMTHPCHWKVRA